MVCDAHQIGSRTTKMIVSAILRCGAQSVRKHTRNVAGSVRPPMGIAIGTWVVGRGFIYLLLVVNLFGGRSALGGLAARLAIYVVSWTPTSKPEAEMALHREPIE